MLHVMLGHIDTNERNREYYDARAKEYFDRYLPGKYRTIPHTPKGMAYPVNWGASRYAANTAYIAILHSKYLAQRNSSSITYQSSLFNYGKSQIDYILGKTGSSMMVGIGIRQPESILHKSSFYSYLTFPKYHEFTAYGSISGHPLLINGIPSDILLYPSAIPKGLARYNEPGLDFAGPSSAAFAALIEQMDFAIPVSSDAQLDLGWNFNISLQT
jgi:endoglucanase